MSYQLSDLDRKNLASFTKDHTRRSLIAIRLAKGTIRGLSKFQIRFTYPLAAIAGRNGSGKSTVLALAACAYHADPKGWGLPGRTYPYYRFSDFFVQTQDEVAVEGVAIQYWFRHDRWKSTENDPSPEGDRYQIRKKNAGGKWNDYSSRIRRPVAFFGIERVVPPSERSALKNQKNYFSLVAGKKSEVEERTRVSASRILGIDYKDFEVRGSGSHRLPLVERKTCKYSGFNMGAGEQALFGLFSAIHSAEKPTLFVVDELELGLHEAAQRNLVTELKKIAFEQRHQFIFTTHSAVVLESLPPEGRFFIENSLSGTQVLEGISAAYAAGRMAERPSAELTLYVEDSNAKQLVMSAMGSDLRRRVLVIEVGSHSAVVSQAAAKFVDRKHDTRDAIFVFDGDQRAALSGHKNRFLGLVDQKKRQEAAAWLDSRVQFLPSDLIPERFIISQVRDNHLERFCEVFGLSNELEAGEILDKALVRGNHSELFWMSEDLALPASQIWQQLTAIVTESDTAAMAEVVELIEERLLQGKQPT